MANMEVITTILIVDMLICLWSVTSRKVRLLLVIIILTIDLVVYLVMIYR